MDIQQTLEPYESKDSKGFDEHVVGSVLRKLRPDEGEEIELPLLAELMAFDFCENYNHEETGWGTYFGPMMVWNNGDGTSTESPSIKKVTPEMLDYWENRASLKINPILIARYSGLVWDFKEKITGERPNIELGKEYVRSILQIAQGKFSKQAFDTFTKLERALKLSIGFNDPELIKLCKETIISFEKDNAIDDKPGLWGYSFDLLIANKKVVLEDEEERNIIDDLEDRLSELTDGSEEKKIDPWAAERAAERLAIYYRKKQKPDDVQRVIFKIGEAYEAIISDGSAMQIAGWYDHLYQLYKSYGFRNEADNYLKKIREIGPKTTEELGTISHSFEIPREKIEGFVTGITEGEIKDVLTRIAIHFIPQKEQVKEQVLDLSKNNPLTYLISQQILDEKGRVVSTIGPLDNDLEGHIIRQISQNLSFSSIFMREAYRKMILDGDLNTQIIIDFIRDSPVISENRISIIEKGLQAYFNDDYLTCIHLLIPQIEEAIRTLVEIAGGNVLKQARGGGYHLRTFDELLRDEITMNSLGEDFADYFRIIFTDQRGWNLRNSVCHGMSPPEVFNIQTADRIIHAVLALGLIHERKE